MVPGDVLEPGAHLQRQGEFARQFGDMAADSLQADQAVVVLAGHDRTKPPSSAASIDRARPLAA